MAETAGFIGIGIMGKGMAANLAKKYNLIIWNRDTTKCEEFVKEFPACKIANTPSEVIQACSITYCMLSTIEASDAVYYQEEGILKGVSEGKCIVDCATLTAEHMTKLSKDVEEKGGKFLEAPVSGSKAPAAQGTLIFLTAGDKEIYDAISEPLELMGKAHYYFGEIGQGSRMKIVVNMIMGGMMNCLAEGLALADGCDLPLDTLIQVLDQGAMSNPMFRGKGPNMIKGDFTPNFPLKHQQKDMRFAIALGDEKGVSLPVSSAANEQFKKARNESGDEDFSAVYKAVKK